MDYQTFCETILELVSGQVSPDTEVSLQQLSKNNGVTQYALCMREEDFKLAPVVYLRPLYERYRAGVSPETLAEEILTHTGSVTPEMPDLLTALDSFSDAKKRLSFRLVSQEHNQTLLQEVPWVPFLDLAIVFILSFDCRGRSEKLFGSPDRTSASVTVNHALTERWEIDETSLLSAAERNAPRISPPVLTSLESLIGMPKTMLTDPDSPASALHVLTNQTGINGAACILYDGVLRDFATEKHADILILPSSVHEVLLLPDTGIASRENLEEMIHAVNREAVSPEERLSDSLYLYQRAEDRIIRPLTTPASPLLSGHAAAQPLRN